jgi:hypothetical protein
MKDDCSAAYGNGGRSEPVNIHSLARALQYLDRLGRLLVSDFVTLYDCMSLIVHTGVQVTQ